MELAKTALNKAAADSTEVNGDGFETTGFKEVLFNAACRMFKLRRVFRVPSKEAVEGLADGLNSKYKGD